MQQEQLIYLWDDGHNDNENIGGGDDDDDYNADAAFAANKGHDDEGDGRPNMKMMIAMTTMTLCFQPEFLNICFWYVPREMRHLPPGGDRDEKLGHVSYL